MKRNFSESESEDGFGDDECGSLKPGSPSQSCHATSNRKKRRGIIEKRRRDRINQSLGELRRLVPAAFEKQGSAKLEKAEILQMTVDHLKMLNAKGLNGYNLDTAALAMDYRSVGFRECMSEVARYMVTMEGMDIQDPLRLRLTSHLQCYSTQRELASKAAAASGLQHGSHSTAWNLPSHHTFNSQCNTGSAAYGSLPPPHAPTTMLTQTGAGPHATQPDHVPSISSSISPTTMKLPGGYQDSSRLHQGLGGASHGPSLAQPSTNTNTLSSSGGHHAGHMLPGLSAQMTSQFPASLSSASLLSPHYNSSPAAQTSLAGLSQGGMKPHRPWGTELAF